MKTRINLYASLLAITILTGCSSSPVYDSESETTEIDTTEIDNADVKTAEVESAEIEVVPVVVDVATVFYFDFDKALLTAESRADLLENAVVLASNTRSVRLEGMLTSEERASTIWHWVSVVLLRLKSSW